MKIFAFVLALLLASTLTAQTVSGGAGLTGSAALSVNPIIESVPSMGWNSWLAKDEAYYPNGAWQPTEAYIRQQSDAMKNLLQPYGYTLMSVDGGWGNRDSSGNIQGVPAQFPSGMTSLSNYVHANGQRFGLYITPATGCLLGYAESKGHEVADAIAFTGWGVDYMKYDQCDVRSAFPSDAALRGETKLFVSSLQQRNPKLAVMVNDYHPEDPYTLGIASLDWFAQTGASEVRIGLDNNATGNQNGWWYYKAFTYDWSQFAAFQSKGRYLDPDNLMCQLYEGGPGLNSPTALVGDAECRTQFNFYAIVAAPLVIGADLTTLTSTTLATLTNTEVIAIDQDALGIMGKRITLADTTCGSTKCSVWVRKTTSGYAVAFFNPDPNAAHSVSVTWSQAGLSGTFNMRDVWQHASVGSSSTGYTASSIPAWGSVVLTLTR